MSAFPLRIVHHHPPNCIRYPVGRDKVNCPSGQEKMPWGTTSARRNIKSYAPRCPYGINRAIRMGCGAPGRRALRVISFSILQSAKSKFPDKTLFYYKMCRSFRQAQTPPRLPLGFPKFVEKPQTQDIVTARHGNNKMQEMHRKTRSNAVKREENGIFGTLQTVIQRV